MSVLYTVVINQLFVPPRVVGHFETAEEAQVWAMNNIPLAGSFCHIVAVESKSQPVVHTPVKVVASPAPVPAVIEEHKV